MISPLSSHAKYSQFFFLLFYAKQSTELSFAEFDNATIKKWQQKSFSKEKKKKTENENKWSQQKTAAVSTFTEGVFDIIEHFGSTESYDK